MTALGNLALGLLELGGLVVLYLLVVLGVLKAAELFVGLVERAWRRRKPEPEATPDRPWQPEWQDEACAITEPSPVVRRPQPRISPTAKRLGREAERYLKEHCS